MAQPGNVTTVVVLGTFLTPEGDPSTGTITFTPSRWLNNPGANVAVPNSSVTKTLGTAGNFSAVLPVTDDGDLTPANWYYTVSEVVDGVSQSYDILLPGSAATGGTVYLADIAPAAALGPEFASTQGPAGSAATITIGTTTSVSNSGTASVTNSGSTSAAILNFVLRDGPTGPQGIQGVQGVQGNTGTFAIGTTTSVANGGTASVTNVGSSSAGTFDFVLRDGPTGPAGPQGPTATLAVGTVGSVPNSGTASVTNVGSSSAGTFDFVLRDGPTGPQGATGTAATVTVGTVTAVPFGGTAAVTNSGTSGSAVFDFVLVTGPQGAIGDLTGAAPISYVGNEFSLLYGAGLGTASGGTLVADFSDATPSALGAAAAGTSTELARGDHVHALPTAGDVGAIGTAALSSATPAALGVASAGTSTDVTRADHVHAMPSAADVGAVGTATTITAGTALAGGGDLSTSRTLDVVLSTATPAALGTAAAGTAVNPARGDHVHAMPSASDVGAVSNSLISGSKGSLITSTGSAVAAQTVGTDGHVLTADSAQTNGIKWAPAASGADIDPLFLAGV